MRKLTERPHEGRCPDDPVELEGQAHAVEGGGRAGATRQQQAERCGEEDGADGVVGEDADLLPLRYACNSALL